MTIQWDDEQAIRDLYRALHNAWNARSGDAFAELFTPDGEVLGYDGSYMNGQEHIRDALHGIFADHHTARYVAVVKSVRQLSDGVGFLRAFVGLVPPGATDIRAELNAWQTITVLRTSGSWKIVFLQNTPAQFHGRPHLNDAFSEELRAELNTTA